MSAARPQTLQDLARIADAQSDHAAAQTARELAAVVGVDPAQKEDA
jgi:hypothetical protein